MKKNIVALAVAAAISAPVAMADAPTVYGQLNLNAAFASGSDATINSTASRLGIKGSEDLGNGLKAVYKVEFGLDEIADAQGISATSTTTLDDGATVDGVDDTATTTTTASGNGVLSQRNAYLGLAGGFGTVLMGRHDTPLKMSQPSDLFNDGAADLSNANMTAGVQVHESRVDDVLAYVSPSFSGVKLIAAAVMGEGKDSAGSYDDATSVALTYGSTKKGLYLAAAQTSAKTNATNTLTVNRFSAQYKANGLVVNAMHSDANYSGTSGTATEGTVTAIQAGYKMGKFMPKIKVSMTDSEVATNDKTTNTAIGLNYSLGKKTTAYIYTVDADKKNTSGTDASFIGLLHKF